MTKCELCNKPFIDGEDVRVTMRATFHKAAIPGTHALDPYDEVLLIHSQCHAEEEI